MPALNVLFWNQVVEANQFILCALSPFSRPSGGRILFVLRRIHVVFWGNSRLLHLPGAGGNFLMIITIDEALAEPHRGIEP
jgi:hypothetical protein